MDVLEELDCVPRSTVRTVAQPRQLLLISKCNGLRRDQASLRPRKLRSTGLGHQEP